MSCREFTDFIADYLSADLEPERRREFERHLDVCPNCQKFLRSYDDAVKLGKRAFDDDDAPVPDTVPEELIQAVLATRSRSTGQ